MPDLPHLAWPYRLGVTVDQDTPAELLASAAAIACTPRGHRDDLPSFGVGDQTFQQGSIDVERLAAELSQSDERLRAEGEEILDLAATTIRTVRLVITGGGA
jgi:hypothetical protein